MDDARSEIERTQEEANEAITIWEQQCHDLEQQLRTALETHGSDAETAEEKQQSEEKAGNDLDARAELAQLEQRIADEQTARSVAEEKADILGKKLSELETSFAHRIESMEADAARARANDKEQLLLERQQLIELERKNDELRKDKAAVESEVDNLRLQVSEQENEIRELFDSLKVLKTNELSSRAAKLAAEALRKEVDTLRQQAVECARAIEGEKLSRMAAEQEARRARSDLAALLGVENTEENQSEIRRRTIEATEHFQRKEQTEIEELRATLNGALNELDKARNEAQIAENRALKSELEFSNMEEALLDVRAELKYMTVARDDLYNAETARRASMESRIASLEADHVSLRRFHASEMEQLRSELSQVTAERDSVTQTLRNLEASKAALLESISHEDSGSDAGAEIRRLRVENAALLSQTYDETARTERRIREARAADRSASQTQLVVERELRRSAERELASANEALAKMREDSPTQDSSAKSRVVELTQELEDSRARCEKLSEQLTEIRRQLEELRRDSRHEIEQLREEYRQAKQRAAQLEEKGRFEAEVRAEVARIQSSPSRGKRGSENVDRALMEVEPSSQTLVDRTTIAPLYDAIENLQQQLDEKHKLHAADNEEIEDLLKLVAQQKINTDALTAALEELGGEAVVQRALKEAEAKAEAQFGTYVHAED